MQHRGTDLILAKKLLTEGKLVAIPTETVYGLAANGLDETAVAGIFRRRTDLHLIRSFFMLLLLSKRNLFPLIGPK